MSATEQRPLDAVKKAVNRAVDEYTQAIEAVDTGFSAPNVMDMDESQIAAFYSKINRHGHTKLRLS